MRGVLYNGSALRKIERGITLGRWDNRIRSVKPTAFKHAFLRRVNNAK